jgi:hypothetical protein
VHRASDVVVFGGGIVPDEDLGQLEAMGVRKVFTPGAATSEIVAWVREAFPAVRSTSGGRAGSPHRPTDCGLAQRTRPAADPGFLREGDL